MEDAISERKEAPGTEPLPSSINLPFLEELYRDYRRDAASVPPHWQRYFAAMSNGDAEVKLGPSFRPATVFRGGESRASVAGLQDRVDQMIRAYRLRGHQV